jgi:hypothetical protein
MAKQESEVPSLVSHEACNDINLKTQTIILIARKDRMYNCRSTWAIFLRRPSVLVPGVENCSIQWRQEPRYGGQSALRCR